MVEAVVIVTKVINEFSGVRIGYWRQLFWVIEPMIDKVSAAFWGSSEDKGEHDKERINFHCL